MSFGFGHGFTRGGGAAAAGAPAFAVDFTTGALPSGTTFSRGTTATYYNQSGLLTTNENLALWSQDYTQASWTKNGATANAVSALAPDGTSTAQKIAEDSSTGQHRIYESITTANTAYTVSVYLKAAERTKAFVVLSDSTTGSAGALVDLAAGTVSADAASVGSWTNISRSITASGNGWYRVTVTATSNAGTTVLPIILLSDGGSTNSSATYTGITGNGIYVWGAQLQNGPNVSAYNPTTSAAVYGPRFDYGPATYVQQNLLLNSGTVGGAPNWTYAGVTSINTGIAPDGTQTATTFTATAQYSAIGQSDVQGLPYVPGATYTFSGWIRLASGTPSTLILQIYDGVAFSITTPTVTSTWQRFSVTATLSTSANRFVATFQDNAASNWATYQIWGAQVNVGSTALSYLATTTARQTICAPRGLLIEEARQNLAFWSQDLTNATGWPASLNVTVSNVSTTAPDGSGTASSMVATTTNGQHWIEPGASCVAGTTYTISCFAKAIGSTSSTTIGLGWAYNSGGANFNLLTGVVQGAPSLGTATIQSVGNGWYRCSVTATPASPGLTLIQLGGLLTSYAGDGATGAYIWGMQIEVGGFVTSYIPTTSGGVTRNADDARIPTFSSWFNQSTGTFLVVYDVGAYSNTPSAFSVNPAGGFNTGGGGFAQWWNGTTNIVTSNGSTAINTPRKEAFAYTASSRAICLNGGTVATDANAPFSGPVVAMFLGDAYSTGQWINGHIKSFSYYNSALTNAQLQVLTT